MLWRPIHAHAEAHDSYWACCVCTHMYGLVVRSCIHIARTHTQTRTHGGQSTASNGCVQCTCYAHNYTIDTLCAVVPLIYGSANTFEANFGETVSNNDDVRARPAIFENQMRVFRSKSQKKQNYTAAMLKCIPFHPQPWKMPHAMHFRTSPNFLAPSLPMSLHLFLCQMLASVRVVHKWVHSYYTVWR